MTMNANRMLKVGKYEIPENVYNEGGVPNEVVNDMIECVINKEDNITQMVSEYFIMIQIMCPADVPQMENILALLSTIQCDMCDKPEKCPNCKK